MKAEFTYQKPDPSGVALNLTIKEALKLRNYLGGCTKTTDPDGTLRQIFDGLSSDDVFGPMIG